MRCSIMKASLSEYMKEISGNELSILEEIISKKYRKFMNFFSLVKDYSDEIVSIKYNFTENTVLDLELSMKGKTKKELKKDMIQEMMDSGYKVESRCTAKKIKLIITYEEE